MISAKFTVQPVDRGWAVSVGPDILVRFATRDEAMLDVNFRVQAIEQCGGEARVEVTPPAAWETERYN
jgi:hypothetical protein